MVKALVWSVAMLTASTAVADQTAKLPAPAPKVTVVMTAVTLADDCGGAAPFGAPAPVPAPAPAATPANVITAKADRADAAVADEEPPASKAKGARAKKRCEQTSMQLSVVAAAGSARSKLKVTKVELFDDTGKSLGVLRASKPRAWDPKAGEYRTWDEAIAAGQTRSVSYALSQPLLASPDRYNQAYTLKATVTAGGTSQTLARDVTLQISAPTILPPGVKT